MNDFLKDKPMLAWMLNLLSSVIVVLLAFWLTGWSDSKNSVSKDIETLKIEKADYDYVNSADDKLQINFTDKCKEMDLRIEKKTDKSLVESMDKKLDLILQKLK